MGLVLANIAGFFARFVVFAVFAAVVMPKPTAEERQAQAPLRQEATWLLQPLRLKKEHQDAAAAKVQDRSVMGCDQLREFR